MRHAYLILAHNEPAILKMLVSLLDSDENDFFIHIDKKVDIEDFKDIKTKCSKIIFTNRIDVRWGNVSQIEAEYILFETAFSLDKYDYFHLLSGVDLPIKSKAYINEFFEKNAGKEFVDIWPVKKSELYNKCLCYNFFTSRIHVGGGYSCMVKILRHLLCPIQKVVGIRRKYPFELYKGANWVSITNKFCEYLLSMKEVILKSFRYTVCGDEIFLQSILMSSDFKKNLYLGNMRFANWKGGNSPQNFEMCDLNKLSTSNCLFARKFSSTSTELLEKLKNITR